MRKKIYFIIYSVLQMIMGIVNFVNYQEYADALYKSVQDALSVMHLVHFYIMHKSVQDA